MSKIGKKPIMIPENAEIVINGETLTVKGRNGEISLKILALINVDLKEKQISFAIQNDSKQARQNWGTMRALVQNAVLGVSEGFSKVLEIEGVGYRALTEGDNLILNVGFSHPVKIAPPPGIKITIDKNTIKVFGSDKALVGQVAAQIRKVRKPEPYKGKGIRYQGEVIRRKEGKKAATAAK